MNKTKAWGYGVLGWLIPGAGHLAQGRIARGVMLGGAVVLMFVVGHLLGGNLHDLSDSSEGVLPRVFALFNLGTGVMYLTSWLSGYGFSNPDNVRQITFEYGNTYLMVAGLLNYLSMLDAFDIGIGRKS